MQRSSSKKSFLSRTSVGFVLTLCLWLVTSPVLAGEAKRAEAEWPDISTAYLLAKVDPPEFLAPAPSFEEAREEARRTAIIPFIGANQALTLMPTPERPTIAASDTAPLERTEVTAGIKVDLGSVNFNLGYTLPAEQVDEFVRPLGVELEPGQDGKRFSLGVKIPF